MDWRGWGGKRGLEDRGRDSGYMHVLYGDENDVSESEIVITVAMGHSGIEKEMRKHERCHVCVESRETLKSLEFQF